MYMYIQLSWNIFYILQSSNIKHFHMCIHSITDLKSILTGSRAKFLKFYTTHLLQLQKVIHSDIGSEFMFPTLRPYYLFGTEVIFLSYYKLYIYVKY